MSSIQINARSVPMDVIDGQTASRLAEQCVLSAMWFGEHTDEIRDTLNDFMFGYVAHQRIYAAMCDLMDEGCPVDPVSVAERLVERRQIDVAGGKEYIGLLVDVVPTSANALRHANYVAGWFMHRTYDVPKPSEWHDLDGDGPHLSVR